MVRSSSLIPPPAEFMQQTSPHIVVCESDDDPEPSSSMDIESNSNKTKKQRANERAKKKKITSLELRMRRALVKTNPWKCSICSNEFRTLQNLQNHVKSNHKECAHFCERCPYFCKQNSDVRKHERCHDQMERKYKNRGGHKCGLCNVWLITPSFTKHLRLYHGE